MFSKFQQLKMFSCKNIEQKFKIEFLIHPREDPPTDLISHKIPCYLVLPRIFHSEIDSFFDSFTKRSNFPSRPSNTTAKTVHPVVESDEFTVSLIDPDDQSAIKVQNLLKIQRDSSVEQLERSLDQCELSLTDDLVLKVLRRHRADLKSAYLFFHWILKGEMQGYAPGSDIYNEILIILGKMKRFNELAQVLNEMSTRKVVINERTYMMLLQRYVAAHKTEEAIEIFNKRREYGLGHDLGAFQMLLCTLCRFRHVEVAEFLFHSKQKEFLPNIKTRNIILNGWCILGRFGEVKRFWNDTLSSRSEPDRFTYGTFINALTRAGKLATAVELFQAMWKKGCPPDVTICNSIIYALCFKKMIPEALGIFKEMDERGCLSNVMTYNSLISHLCRVRSMEKAYELLDEMEQKGGHCSPNARTYGYFLKSTEKPEEISALLERMGRNGHTINGDTYNLILSLYVKWDLPENAKSIWAEMERNGWGPDKRSYTIMVHGLYHKGMIERALNFYNEMESKGMLLDRWTKVLVKAMIIEMEKRDGGRDVPSRV